MLVKCNAAMTFDLEALGLQTIHCLQCSVVVLVNPPADLKRLLCCPSCRR